MHLLKYLLIAAGVLIPIFQQIIKTKKEEKPEAIKFSKGGWWFNIILPVICLILGLYLMNEEEKAAAIEKSSLLTKQKNDSILLLRRWEYDTLRFAQLVDSSEKILFKSTKNLKLTEHNLQLSDMLLRVQAENTDLSQKSLKTAQKLIYKLPDTMAYRFVAEFKLKDKWRCFENKLNVLSQGKEEKEYLINGRYYYNTKNIFSLATLCESDDSTLLELVNICSRLLDASIDFSKNNLSSYMMWPNNPYRYILNNYPYKKWVKVYQKKLDSVAATFNYYYDRNKKSIIVIPDIDLYIPIVAVGFKEDRGLYELDNTTLSFFISKPEKQIPDMSIRSVTIKLKERDLLYFYDLLRTSSNKLPKNYDEVENDCVVFQKKVTLLYNRIHSNMLNSYERRILQEW